MKKIFIIAGEESGDKIGALVIKRLSELSDCEFVGVGGARMENLGLKSLFSIDNINLMGFLEILPYIFKLRHLIKLTIDKIIEYQPDVIITIDSPGFTYRVVAGVKGKVSAKLVHIVAPSVWAYKPERAKKYADIYDLLLTLLPFEPQYFTREGLESIFVGHFAFEQDLCNDKKLFRQKYNIPAANKLICMTPGSRAGEVNRHLPIFLDSIEMLMKKFQISVAILASSQKILAQIENEVRRRKLLNVIITLEDKFEAYKGADLCLAKSGTNTIEISLHKTPQIIAYKVNFLSWFYIRSKILIKFANLINIITDKEIIPEFIQDKCTKENLAISLDNLLSNKDVLEQQIKDSERILDSMRNPRGAPSLISAEVILKLLD